jgi:hypothetical protein
MIEFLWRCGSQIVIGITDRVINIVRVPLNLQSLVRLVLVRYEQRYVAKAWHGERTRCHLLENCVVVVK